VPGAVYVLDEGSDYGSEGRLVCQQPYDLRGSPVIECQRSREWIGSGTCRKFCIPIF